MTEYKKCIAFWFFAFGLLNVLIYSIVQVMYQAEMTAAGIGLTVSSTLVICLFLAFNDPCVRQIVDDEDSISEEDFE